MTNTNFQNTRYIVLSRVTSFNVLTDGGLEACKNEFPSPAPQYTEYVLFDTEANATYGGTYADFKAASRHAEELNYYA